MEFEPELETVHIDNMEGVNLNSNIEPVTDLVNDYEVGKLNAQDQFELYVHMLWETCIIPYINNSNDAKVLIKLTENDFDKFYRFMLDNSPVVQYL
jgi:hypothetical protein